MAIMYLSEETFTCPKEQMMHKQFSLALTMLIPNVNFFENSMKPDINSIKNRYIVAQYDNDQKMTWAAI